MAAMSTAKDISRTAFVEMNRSPSSTDLSPSFSDDATGSVGSRTIA